MSVVRFQALSALKQALTPVLPEIEDIKVEFEDSDKPACYPNLVIDTFGRFAFEPLDADEIESTPTDVKVHVGDFSGQVRLRLGARSRAERRELGDRVTNEFLKTPGKSGALVLQLRDFQVSGYPFKGPIPVAFRVGEQDWDEEFVFERKRFQDLVLDVELPALVTWTNTYDINELVLAFSEDLTSTTPTYEQAAVTDAGDLEDIP